MERGDNFMQSVFKVELFFWAWIRSAECEQKASSKPSLSCVRFFLPFFLPKTSGATDSPIFLKEGGKFKKRPLSSTAGLCHLISSSSIDASGMHSTSSCPEASILKLKYLLSPCVNS